MFHSTIHSKIGIITTHALLYTIVCGQTENKQQICIKGVVPNGSRSKRQFQCKLQTVERALNNSRR